MDKKQMSLILNMLIIIFECIGFIVTMFTNNRINFEYYTEDSNILALLASTLYVLFILASKKLPKWLSTLKYLATICLTITFVVVLFILIPMYNFDFFGLLFDGSFLYHHMICPILSILSFIIFDDVGNITLKDNILSMIIPAIYGLILIPLNMFDIIIGPYPFLMVKEQNIIVSVIWTIVLFGLSFLIAYVIRKLYSKYSYRGA